VVIGTPPVSFEEEMQTMITFAGGFIDTDVLYHENMHQWWGDNVTESGYNMTFFKEGMATVAEFLYHARLAENAAGGPYSPNGQAAFQDSLVQQFNQIYAFKGVFWAVAPSDPEPAGLFSRDSTYSRPGAAYLALRQILGHGNFTRALQQIQRTYGGSHVTEPELEAAFTRWLPVQTSACRARLSQFFTQWFDTAYPAGGQNKPQITRPRLAGPGLAGRGFYTPGGGCSWRVPASGRVPRSVPDDRGTCASRAEPAAPTRSCQAHRRRAATVPPGIAARPGRALRAAAGKPGRWR